MHMPDGFLSVPVAAGTAACSALALGIALRRAGRDLPPRRAPVLGMAAAFIFSAQMLNFPVAGGTSGHLGGGVLAAVLLGPSAGLIALSAVLIVQCFLFADGGVTALGANILNLGVLAGVGGYWIARSIWRAAPGIRGRVFGAAVAAWLSIPLAAAGCAAQLALSGTAPWSLVFPAMTGVHFLIGAGEALITGMALAAVAKLRPDLIPGNAPEKGGIARVALAGLIVSATLVALLAPLACAWPDGLEWVAERAGFAGAQAGGSPIPSPIPDYEIPGVGNAWLATALAGIVGLALVFAASWAVARLAVPPEKGETACRG
jgi:cobalt/nickel transport system permease protein